MASAVSSHHRVFAPQAFFESYPKSLSKKTLAFGYPQDKVLFVRNPRWRLVIAGAVGGNSEPDDSENADQDSDKAKNRLSREALERLIGEDDSKFSGFDLAMLIRKKYGRSYDVQLIKKEFMGRNLLAMNVMWKYVEQRSFPLTEEEYLLRLDDVANTLKCWGAVSHVRNTLEKLKERPRIGKAVSIFIDMDETGERSNEWIYK